MTTVDGAKHNERCYVLVLAYIYIYIRCAIQIHLFLSFSRPTIHCHLFFLPLYFFFRALLHPRASCFSPVSRSPLAPPPFSPSVAFHLPVIRPIAQNHLWLPFLSRLLSIWPRVDTLLLPVFIVTTAAMLSHCATPPPQSGFLQYYTFARFYDLSLFFLFTLASTFGLFAWMCVCVCAWFAVAFGATIAAECKTSWYTWVYV